MIFLKKTLYSLMLNDEVVREVDLLAHRLGTNRSALINQILAEYVNYTTPERRINDVLSAIEQLMQPSSDLVPFFAPNSYSMSLKSSLEYKYRPTVKYEVQLFRGEEENIGELSVVFRTQSSALISVMTEFFRLWKSIEDAHLAPKVGHRQHYALYDGRFTRSITHMRWKPPIIPRCSTAPSTSDRFSDRFRSRGTVFRLSALSERSCKAT